MGNRKRRRKIRNEDGILKRVILYKITLFVMIINLFIKINLGSLNHLLFVHLDLHIM